MQFDNQTGSSLLDKQEMHCTVCNDDKRTGNHSKSNHVIPIGLGVKAESAQDRGTGDFNIQTVLVINQGEVCHFIDNQGFKSIMEN